MIQAELSNQISELLQYTYEHADRQDMEKELIEIANNISEVIKSAIYEGKEAECIKEINSLFEGATLDIKKFCFVAEKCLLKYEESILSGYEESPYIQQIENKNEQLKDLHDYIFYSNNAREMYHKRYIAQSGRFIGKGVVYSVITGGYDCIREPVIDDNSDLDYYLVTDKPISNYRGRWTIKVIENVDNLSQKQLSRWAKMMPFILFPEYDWSIYLDGSLQIKRDMESFVVRYAKESGMICFPHHESKTFEDEISLILSNVRANKEELLSQAKRYREQGYLGDNGFIEAGCLVREHNDNELKKVMDDWWHEYISYNHGRDQMSFGYACWKNNYKYDLCDLIISRNEWLENNEHI